MYVKFIKFIYVKVIYVVDGLEWCENIIYSNNVIYGGKLLETTHTGRTLSDSDINTNAL